MRARNLVRDQDRVRADLKRRYSAILIDEFQDTDPIQYEILLYLAEVRRVRQGLAQGQSRLPAKIFVVGDPKQSIYAFRRADIEAYLEVVEKIIKAQNGVECRLTTNFRSDAAILDAVNGVFETLIQAQDGVQPPYIAIHPAPGRVAAQRPTLLNVLVRKIVAADQEINAETARRLEGESLARWLKRSGVRQDHDPQRAAAKASALSRKISPFSFASSPTSTITWNPFAARGSAMSSKASAIFTRPKKSSTRSTCCARWKIPSTASRWSACCVRLWGAHGPADL